MSIDECRIKEFYRLKIVVRRGNELRVSGFKVQRLDRLESGEPGTENPDKVSVFSVQVSGGTEGSGLWVQRLDD